jgi:hypothetical protein
MKPHPDVFFSFFLYLFDRMMCSSNFAFLYTNAVVYMSRDGTSVTQTSTRKKGEHGTRHHNALEETRTFSTSHVLGTH